MPTARARRLAAAALGTLPAGAVVAPGAAATAPAAPAAAMVVALVLAAAPATLAAQNATANLRGVVTGAGGAPLADAQVQVRNLASGVRRGALTNASGAYNVGGLQPGAYEVRVARIGFTPVTQTVRLTVGEVTTRDFRIGEAAVQLNTVTVEATRSTDRSSSEVAANVSTEQIENLPQNNRNFIDFAALAPASSGAARGSRRAACRRTTRTCSSTARRTRATCCRAASSARTAASAGATCAAWGRCRGTRSRRARCRSSAW
jgi:hypothetical protein